MLSVAMVGFDAAPTQSQAAAETALVAFESELTGMPLNFASLCIFTNKAGGFYGAGRSFGMESPPFRG
jgi:hypothetical protein